MSTLQEVFTNANHHVTSVNTDGADSAESMLSPNTLFASNHHGWDNVSVVTDSFSETDVLNHLPKDMQQLSALIANQIAIQIKQNKNNKKHKNQKKNSSISSSESEDSSSDDGEKEGTQPEEIEERHNKKRRTQRLPVNTFKFPDIPKFDGMSDKDCERFIADLCNIFENAGQKTTDREKVGYAARFLTGRARLNFQIHMKESGSSRLYANYNLFVTELRKLYAEPDRCQAAHRKLKDMRYTNTTVLDHITQFDELLADIGQPLPPRTAIFFFRFGLDKQVTEKMDKISVEEPNALRDVEELALLAESKVKEELYRNSSEQAILPLPPAPQADPKGNPFPRPKETPQCSRCLGRGHAPDACRVAEGKLHLLCTFCHKRGHLAEDCYKARNMENKANAILKSLKLKRPVPNPAPATPLPPLENPPIGRTFICNVMQTISKIANTDADQPFHLPVTLIDEHNGTITKLRALLDTGASANFIDVALVSKLGLSTRTLAVPMTLELADGGTSRSGDITQEVEYILEIGSKHRAKTSLLVTSIPGWDLILGLPWLKLHNPNINWKEGRIDFHSSETSQSIPPVAYRDINALQKAILKDVSVIGTVSDVSVLDTGSVLDHNNEAARSDERVTMRY